MSASAKDIYPPKVNGFSKPLHTLQIISWFVYGYLNINFHAIFGSHDNALFIVLNGIHLILSFIMFISAYNATSANVVDPYIDERGFPNPTMSIIKFQNKYYETLKNKDLFWCKYCDWYVTKTSKHCRACNRCTCDFDHHCRWLNNCISHRNYKSFFIAICVTELLLWYEIVVGVLMLSNKIDIISHHLFIDSAYSTLIYTLITIQVFIASFMALPLFQLILFHLFLMKKHISTYDWVLLREEKKLNKIKQKQQQKNKPTQKKKQSLSIKINRNKNDSFNKYIENEQHDQKTIDSLCSSNDIKNQTKIKEKMMKTTRKKLKIALKKYLYSLRDCESKFNQKNISIDDKTDIVPKNAKNMHSIDPHLDVVKISGLSTNDSTDDSPNQYNNNNNSSILSQEWTPPNLQQRILNTIRCDSTKTLKDRNSVHVAAIKVPKNSRCQKYSSEDQNTNDNEPDDIIFGPGYISKNCANSELTQQNNQLETATVAQTQTVNQHQQIDI